MPHKLKVFLEVIPQFEQDIALELIAAWIDDIQAIRSLLANRPTSNRYTGTDLLISLRQVPGP